MSHITAPSVRRQYTTFEDKGWKSLPRAEKNALINTSMLFGAVIGAGAVVPRLTGYSLSLSETTSFASVGMLLVLARYVQDKKTQDGHLDIYRVAIDRAIEYGDIDEIQRIYKGPDVRAIGGLETIDNATALRLFTRKHPAVNSRIIRKYSSFKYEGFTSIPRAEKTALIATAIFFGTLVVASLDKTHQWNGWVAPIGLAGMGLLLALYVSDKKIQDAHLDTYRVAIDRAIKYNDSNEIQRIYKGSDVRAIGGIKTIDNATALRLFTREH